MWITPNDSFKQKVSKDKEQNSKQGGDKKYEQFDDLGIILS